jgi:flavin-binding protein dodecin
VIVSVSVIEKSPVVRLRQPVAVLPTENVTPKSGPPLASNALARPTKVNLSPLYTHAAPTAGAEAQRVAVVKAKTQQINNAPETLMKIDKLEVVEGQVVYINEAQNPHYKLSISNLHLELANLSNHFSQGPAHLVLRGRFMDSGLTTVTGDFRPEKSGSDFDLDLAIRDASLPALNNLLRAYGRFDVQSGQLSIFSQVKVRRGEMKGYVKPLFSNVNVYDPAKDKNKSVLHQAYERAVGAAAKVVKNSSTQKVATKVDVSGKLDNPNVSTWQALVQFVQNGFVNAILPGFDRQTKETAPG